MSHKLRVFVAMPGTTMGPNAKFDPKGVQDNVLPLIATKLHALTGREVELVIEKEKLDWTQVSGLKGWGDDAALAYGISAIPANVLIGPDGKVVAWGLYDDNIDKVLSSTIQ